MTLSIESIFRFYLLTSFSKSSPGFTPSPRRYSSAGSGGSTPSTSSSSSSRSSFRFQSQSLSVSLVFNVSFDLQCFSKKHSHNSNLHFIEQCLKLGDEHYSHCQLPKLIDTFGLKIRGRVQEVL